MKTALTAILAASIVAAHTAELPAGAVDNPWIRLIPAGTFSGRDGRGPYNAGDFTALQQIADLTRNFHGTTDILFDYEHQSLYSAENGKPAPAAGWIKEVEARADGLYGRVEWTAAAASLIEAKEYRYLSPVFFHKADGEILALRNVGLTNSPNLNLNEVSAHSLLLPTKTAEVSMKQVLAALGLADGASENDVLSAINSLMTSSTAIAVAFGLTKDAKSDAIALAVQTALADRKKIALAAGQKEDATVDEIVSAFSSAQSTTVDPTKWVPIAQVQAMQTDLKALQDRNADEDAEHAVGQAIKDGKLAPALKDWGISLHKSDPKQFQTFVGGAPVLTSAQRSVTVPPTKDSALSALDDTDIAVMTQMGLSAEDMKKSKEAMEAGR